MNVKELIAALKKENPNRIVVMAKDSEGNGHSPLSSFWIGTYSADTTWSGDVGLEKLTEDDRKAGYTDEDILQGVPALILTPTN